MRIIDLQVFIYYLYERMVFIMKFTYDLYIYLEICDVFIGNLVFVIRIWYFTRGLHLGRWVCDVTSCQGRD